MPVVDCGGFAFSFYVRQSLTCARKWRKPLRASSSGRSFRSRATPGFLTRPPGAMLAAFSAQEGPRGLKRPSETAQERPKTQRNAPRGPKSGPGRPQDGRRGPRGAPGGPQEDPHEGPQGPEPSISSRFSADWQGDGKSASERSSAQGFSPKWGGVWGGAGRGTIGLTRPPGAKLAAFSVQDGSRDLQEAPKTA